MLMGSGVRYWSGRKVKMEIPDTIITVNSMEMDSCKKSLGGNIRRSVFGPGSLVWLSLGVLLCGFPALAQSQQTPTVVGVESSLPDAPGTGASSGEQLPDQKFSGNISGTVVDQTGAVVAGARVRLTREAQSLNQEVLSGDDGRFSFADIAPGPFQLTIAAAGFATQASSGILRSGESYIVPQMALAVATAIANMRVESSRTEVAEEQIKDQEKQRLLGFIPNFYVSYVPNAVPLNSKKKFELAWRTTVDPVTLVLTGAIAGVQQARNDISGYGQGAQGYGKRYGAFYTNLVTGTFMGSAILPSLLKQDPRYFYKGSGSTRSRILHAIANSVICKGDNGHWQANYSNMLGNLAAGGISNLYYPAKDRNGAELTFENAAIAIGATAAFNLLQEFLSRKLTPHVPNHQPAKP
jgi:hypothetical protein